MIAKLTGRIDAVGDGEVVIDVGGVGYLLQVSARTLGGLTVGEVASVLVETQVRADAIQLFAFAAAAERAWFRALQTVQGVGPRAALAVLSALSPDELAAAIVAGDRRAILAASGVGPKLAARLLSELKDRAVAATVLPATAARAASHLPSASGDAVSALVNLGFRPVDALAAVTEAAARLGEGAAVDALIRSGLAALAPKEGAS
ncbi:MAG: Holliday junction branch migration protein RuvA [Rhodospirillales bacterium]|nr:Holliday junction branch migration protein RuvA [Rhodospirillales bacterium]